ncbi:MAG: VTT domain-containing protein [Rhodospirillales bacterium]|nr:VTT domain-containing protein [Rhodospirillales bacterium]
MSFRFLFRGLILIASLVVAGFFIKFTGLDTTLDKAWIDSDIRGQGLAGEILFLAAGGLFTAIGFPRQLVGFLGGYAFGVAWGTTLALGGATLGCVLAFSYARLIGRDFVNARFSGRIKKFDDFLSDNPFTMTLLIRLLPVGSNLVTNLVAGVTGVRPLLFISGSAIGYIPQTLVFALVGSGIALEPGLRISLSILLFVLSGMLGVYLYRKYRHNKTFDDKVERQLGSPSA